jgi:hypothetical protein
VIRRTLSILVALALLLPCALSIALAGVIIVGPGRGLTGNDTGGIIQYSPDLDHAAYRQMAAEWCARWDRLSHITSMHLRYGDYVSFVCIDRPWMIH